MTDTENLLSRAYAKVLEVNLATDDFTALCLREDERIQGSKFTDWAYIFAEEGHVAPEDKEGFINIFNSQSLLKRMSEYDGNVEITKRFKRLTDGLFIDVQAIFFKSTKWSSDNPIIIVAVRYLNG